MSAATPPPVDAAELVAPTPRELEAGYRDYRRRQARNLVGMLPRAAVRPLYRRAATVLGAGRATDDPLSLLVAYCERLLPLPPFDVWAADARESPAAHLADLDDSPLAPTPASPATLEARRFRYEEDEWVARLRAFRDRGVWRGFIAFRSASSDATPRTALIFSESDPANLRDRFLDFEPAALQAFLRSALP